MHSMRLIPALLLPLCFAGSGLAIASQESPSTGTSADYWSRHQQRVLDSYTRMGLSTQRPESDRGYDRSMDAAQRTLENVQVGNVHERVRDLLSEANDRYWQRRFDTRTLPGDAWTPQQAGWMTPAGEPAVEHWPWWAW